ncbi:MAG: hypothetical protein KKD38_03400, partial [Candidatus Delongbacteria bacterium]|nr:hypothetical protein [Candidatus Delongbacteria bacterium]MCG2760967.1 hypothetical protein [Candidatus Delongbacteria bacterium]
QNLEEAGFELLDDKVEGLEYALVKQENFFLASKEFFEDYKNIDLDNSINGTIKYKGKTFYLNLEVYSREKRRLVIKSEMKGNKQALLAFFYQVTKEIISSMGVDYQVKNIFPVEDENYFYKYIKFSYEAEKLFESDEPDKYYSLVDDLEAIKNKFDEYPVFSELYDDLMSQSEDFKKAGPLDKPIANVSQSVSPEDNEVEKFARDLIANGYIFSFRGIIQGPVEDKQELVNLGINYVVKLKKSYRNSLIKEIKRRQGNPHFTDMGRYFFSLNDKESKIFRDFVLRQTIILRFLDENGILIIEAEKTINQRDYSNGAYRHSKTLPMPITPRGPANPAFGLKNSVKINFLFEDLKKSDYDRIAKTEIEILFD